MPQIRPCFESHIMRKCIHPIGSRAGTTLLPPFTATLVESETQLEQPGLLASNRNYP